MMFLVEKTFKDKKTKKIYEKGMLYETDDKKRIEELKEGGYLGPELVIKEELMSEEVEKQSTEEEKPKSKRKGDK